MTPPAVGALFRAAFVASCLRGALPPVDLRAVCLVRAICARERTRCNHGEPRALASVEMEGACACGGASAESRSRVRGSRRRTPFVDHGLHCRMRIRDSDSEIQGRAARGTTRVSVTRPASYKWRSLDLRRSKSEVTTSVELKVWSLDLRRAESEVDLL